jgi:D-aminoacyl-tRNA deacylase
MKFAVLYSKKDLAGVNIAQELKDHYLPQTPIIEMKKESIFNEDIDKDIRLKDMDFLIFATKHQSKEKIPSLSLHAPGNWRNADFGGKSGKICPTSSLALKFLFQKLNENSQDKNVTLECTHHGPLIDKPCCFIEIGSDEAAWKDKELGKIIAKTIADFQNFKKTKYKTAIGIGGPHYCPNFNKIQKNSDIAISHIIPEYVLPLTRPMLEEAIAKTKEDIDLILVDWKGCGKSEEREKVIEIIEKIGIGWERTSKIEK